MTDLNAEDTSSVDGQVEWVNGSARLSGVDKAGTTSAVSATTAAEAVTNLDAENTSSVDGQVEWVNGSARSGVGDGAGTTRAVSATMAAEAVIDLNAEDTSSRWSGRMGQRQRIEHSTSVNGRNEGPQGVFEHRGRSWSMDGVNQSG